MRLKLIPIITFWTLMLSAQRVDYKHYNLQNSVFVSSDDFDENYLDSLEKYYRVSKVDTIKLALLYDLAYYWHTRDLNKSDSLTGVAIAAADELGDQVWKSRMAIIRAAILLRDEKLKAAEDVLNGAKTNVPQNLLPFWYTQLGYVYERRGELDRAVEFALESLNIGKNNNDDKAIALAYSDLANLYYKQNKIDQALEYGLESLKIFENRGISDLDYSFTLYVVGFIYAETNDLDLAQKYLEESNLMSEQYGFYNNLSDTYISLTELHLRKNELQKASLAAKEAIKYSTLLKNNFLLMRSWLAVGKYQNLSGEYEQAIVSLYQSLDIGTEVFGDDFVLAQIQQELSKAYAGLGDYTNAYKARLKYDAYRDSLYTLETNTLIAQMQTQFEVSQKEETIAQQELRLKQGNLIQLLIGGLLFFVLVITFVILRSAIKNRKTNKKLKNLNENLEESIKALDKSNAEKELLLKEIHHRVKNNLAVVTGLLELQSAHFENPELFSAIQESKKRVSSMSIIHQKLYQKDNLTAIEMKDYFESLGESLEDAFSGNSEIQLTYPMEKIYLDVDTAIPIGLITNELVTNAYKHAFPDSRKGFINISLSLSEDGFFRLLVEDNGVGFKNSEKTSGGFGSQLIQLLAIQIGATMKKKSMPNTSVELIWKKKKILN